MRIPQWTTSSRRLLPAGVAVILVLMPFHAALSVGLSRLVGHYTLLRLWKECLLIPLAIAAGCTLAGDAGLRRELGRSWLVRLIAVYLGVQLLWGIVACLAHAVGAKALGYGWLSDSRYLVFFLIVWVIARRAAVLRTWWPGLVFWPAAIVVVVGLLQYFVLPYDVMKHFGYSASTIFPYEDINHNVHYIRIMSTMRGANPLGAYLVVVLSLLLAWRRKDRLWWYVLAGGGLLALVLTFSRGAWLGLAAGLAVLLWAGVLHTHAARAVPIAAAGLVLAGSAAVLLHGNTTFQNVILHTQTHSAVRTTSDQGHASALREGLRDALHEPLGRGPGTAGPASAYNTGHSVRIAENYFIQIAQETGWLGLGLFAAVNVTVGRMLWQRRQDALALGLLAALIGVSVINLLSHAWADDTLAYIWWGLAAMALGSGTIQTVERRTNIWPENVKQVTSGSRTTGG